MVDPKADPQGRPRKAASLVQLQMSFLLIVVLTQSWYDWAHKEDLVASYLLIILETEAVLDFNDDTVHDICLSCIIDLIWDVAVTR